MAKKRVARKNTKSNQTVYEKRLPQNITAMGEKVEENKNIYISQPVYKTIHRFTQGKTVNESGGLLIGSIIEEFGKTNIVIEGFVEAKFCEATPTTLKFTHETWEYCHKEMARKFPGKKIVGWIHTHPDFGIFLSEYDKFIHENFFKEDYEIAYVVDPIQGIEGFYIWINGKIERCKGFYIFDKTGTKISIESDADKKESPPANRKSSLLRDIVIAALFAAVVFLTMSVINLNNELSTIKKQQEAIVTSAYQSLAYLQQQIEDLQMQIEELLPPSDEGQDEQKQSNTSDADSSDSNNTDLPSTEHEEGNPQ